MPTTITTLLDRAAATGGRPFLTWYGSGGERVELSGAVTANWVTKTANLLVEEFDAGPGTLVRLVLPAHWRTVIWALAAWRVGAGVVWEKARVSGGAAGSHVNVVVTDRPDQTSDTGVPVVAVNLSALARSFDGELPAGVLDAASAVMTYGDTLGWVPATEPTALAIVGAASTSHADLVAWSHRAHISAGSRVATGVGLPDPAIEAEPEGSRGPRRDEPNGAAVALLLQRVLAAMEARASLVILSPELEAELGDDPERRVHLLASERVTAEL